jgi:hypothetical protein
MFFRLYILCLLLAQWAPNPQSPDFGFPKTEPSETRVSKVFGTPTSLVTPSEPPRPSQPVEIDVSVKPSHKKPQSQPKKKPHHKPKPKPESHRPTPPSVSDNMGGGDGYRSVAYFVNWVGFNHVNGHHYNDILISLGHLRPQVHTGQSPRRETNPHPLRLCRQPRRRHRRPHGQLVRRRNPLREGLVE